MNKKENKKVNGNVNNKKVISLFVFSFIAPLLLAFILLKTNWSPSHQVNNGEFLAQKITLTDWQLIEPKQWSIAQQVAGKCENKCLYNQQQIQQTANALGKYKDKVDLVLLGSLQPLPGGKSYPLQHHALQANTLYLIDRFGLIVLAYPLSDNPEENRLIKQGLIKDLKKLFKFARSA
ncbi:transmembrane cytochrome oxidase associated protein [Psychromonas sp. Urea-02u-13]|uniref:transmembrane cytochrome oxidase associated protein n=1 Tax=Psychromonas sp. Urea-02u-13 TaxID=2058326 RepID=UPI000C333184|nr:transmembrane cytochrome oxidase associated protein [Psychromonas sp. Urea-02u-13]PKG40016.1 transmembrane cytochrome oxidase associated protein [Psychromonas sp. Urea-02u-13]